MKTIFAGTNSEKLVFWQKIYFCFNLVGLCSIVAANFFKKQLLPYKAVITTYLLIVLSIWALSMSITFILKRKINSTETIP
jgi:hypothetical protein